MVKGVDQKMKHRGDRTDLKAAWIARGTVGRVLGFGDLTCFQVCFLLIKGHFCC